MQTSNTYNIAGVHMRLHSDNRYLSDRMKIFENRSTANVDLYADIWRCNYIEEPKGKMIVDEFVKWMKKDDEGGGFHVYRKDMNDRHVLAHIDINRDWSHNTIKCLNIKSDNTEALVGREDWTEYYSFMLMGIVFRNRLLNMGGIVIHASSIDWKGKGILFTAPSGTGKSTHVRLWEKYIGDEVTVVNDDTPAIRFFEGVPTLCGTPWSGSSDKFANKRVPVGAIVVLKQADENSIVKLTAIEALPQIMPRVFLPYFDMELMEKAYTVLEGIIKQAPIYLLRCTPEKQAMELVYQCVR